jgi:hypothetical protein
MRERSSIMDDLFLLYSSNWNRLLKSQGSGICRCAEGCRRLRVSIRTCGISLPEIWTIHPHSRYRPPRGLDDSSALAVQASQRSGRFIRTCGTSLPEVWTIHPHLRYKPPRGLDDSSALAVQASQRSGRLIRTCDIRSR